MRNKYTKGALMVAPKKVPITMFKFDRVWVEVSYMAEQYWVCMRVDGENVGECLVCKSVLGIPANVARVKKAYYEKLGIVDDLNNKGHNYYSASRPTGAKSTRRGLTCHPVNAGNNGTPKKKVPK